MNNTKALLFLLLTIGIVACGTNDDDTKWVSHSENDQYSLEHPEDWKFDQTDKQTTFSVFSEATSENDNFRDNINLVSEAIPNKNVTLDEYIELTVTNLANFLENQSKIEVTKRDNYQVLTYSGKTSGYDLKFEQRVWFKDGSAHILTYTSEIEEYELHKDKARKIMDSFVMK